MGLKPQISVVLCCAPGEEIVLENTLQALCQQTFSDFEVIVIADGFSRENQLVWQKFSEKLTTSYFERPATKNVALSRNIGVKKAKAAKIIFLDSDVALTEQALSVYHEQLQDEYSLVLGKFQAENNIMRPFFKNKQFENFINSGENKILFYQPYLHTFSANTGIYKSTFQRVGGFNESFTGYGMEDTDLAYRLYQYGVKFNFSDEIEAIHQKKEKKGDFYDHKYTIRNAGRIIRLLFAEVKRFFERDEQEIKQNFRKIAAIYDQREVYTDLLRYFLLKGELSKASEYFPLTNQERAKEYLKAYQTGKIHWKKIFSERNYRLEADPEAESLVFNLFWLYPLV